MADTAANYVGCSGAQIMSDLDKSRQVSSRAQMRMLDVLVTTHHYPLHGLVDAPRAITIMIQALRKRLAY